MRLREYLPLVSYFNYAHEHEDEIINGFRENVESGRNMFKGQGKHIVKLALHGLYAPILTGYLLLGISTGEWNPIKQFTESEIRAKRSQIERANQINLEDKLGQDFREAPLK